MTQDPRSLVPEHAKISLEDFLAYIEALTGPIKGFGGMQAQGAEELYNTFGAPFADAIASTGAPQPEMMGPPKPKAPQELGPVFGSGMNMEPPQSLRLGPGQQPAGRAVPRPAMRRPPMQMEAQPSMYLQNRTRTNFADQTTPGIQTPSGRRVFHPSESSGQPVTIPGKTTSFKGGRFVEETNRPEMTLPAETERARMLRMQLARGARRQMPQPRPQQNFDISESDRELLSLFDL